MLNVSSGSMNQSSKNYKTPYFQFLLIKWRKACDIISVENQYYNEETHLDNFRFGDPEFNIKDIY
jgi:hypothetical protein